MRGKEKCKILKQIRQEIAAQNDIDLVIKECTHQGECKGTCPRCEAEVRYLEQELAKRQKLGKVVALAGISVAMMATTAGCTFADAVKDTAHAIFGVENEPELAGVAEIQGGEAEDPQVLEGDVVYTPEDENNE